MRKSQRTRHRQSRRGSGGSPGKFEKPGFGWKLKVLVILGIFAGAGSLILFFGHSGDADQRPPRASSTFGHSNLNNAAAEPRTEENGDAFSSKVNRGNDLLAQGKVEEAVQTFMEAMRMNPENEDVHYDLGLALTRQGKLEEAIQQYLEALRIFPNYVEAHNNLGNLLMRTGRTGEAIQHFEIALKIMPVYASAHNNLGTALQKTGRMDDALLHFQKAVQINPDYWEAHFNVATSYLQQGRKTEARTELETVLRLRPDFLPAKSALREISGEATNAPAAVEVQPR